MGEGAFSTVTTFVPKIVLVATTAMPHARQRRSRNQHLFEWRFRQYFVDVLWCSRSSLATSNFIFQLQVRILWIKSKKESFFTRTGSLPLILSRNVWWVPSRVHPRAHTRRTAGYWATSTTRRSSATRRRRTRKQSNL